MSKKITIVGAGLAGSLLAIYMAKKGFEVDLYERRPDLRKFDAGAGKSINLALSARGIYALNEVGLYDEIKKISIPMYGRMIHSAGGNTMLQPYGKDNTEYINAVSRSELNKKLYDLAEKFSGVKIYFSHRCTGVNLDSNELFFHNDTTGDIISVAADVIIASDGATSAVRHEMQKIPRFDFSQEYENYGYKELFIPPGEPGTFQIEMNALHIWPRGSFMLIALPNIDFSFTCTLFLAYDKSLGGENSFEFLNSNERVNEFFEKEFPDAYKLMPQLTDTYFSNPTGSLMTVKCHPYSFKNRILLIGDAAHAIVPFFGQGMNAAFEDCSYLSACLDKYGDDWGQIFNDFQEQRKPNSDAIAFLAQENFIEMRDLVAKPEFQLKKKIEAELSKRFPSKFIPKYSMVTFDRVPYSTALERGKIQGEILDELSRSIIDVNNVDWEKAAELVNYTLTDLF
jgi:kynurenine 3-monooxygenase